MRECPFFKKGQARKGKILTFLGTRLAGPNDFFEIQELLTAHYEECYGRGAVTLLGDHFWEDIKESLFSPTSDTGPKFIVAFDEKNELLGLSYFDASEHEVWIQMITEYEQAARFNVIDALLDATITWAEIHDIPKLAFNLPAARDATELFTFMSNRGFIVRSLGTNCEKKVMVRIA